MSDDEFTSESFNIFSTNASYAISKVPSSPSGLKAQLVNEVSSTRLCVGHFITRHGSLCMFRPSVQSQYHLHERP